MNAYCNMSVPPRTAMAWQVKSVGGRLVFDLARVAGLPVESDESKKTWLTDFIQTSEPALSATVRPLRYTVAELLPRTVALSNGYRLCDDPLLAIAMICRTVNGLYVPQRRLSVPADGFTWLYAYPEKDFT